MNKKHQIRVLAMQTLFLWDTHGCSDIGMARQLVADGTQDPTARQLAIDMANAAWEQRQTSDRWVERMAPNWPTHRQPGIDRNVLRLAVWELTNTTTPAKVVVDEAIELAKQFSTQQSAAFVNGVMDAILKEHEALIGKSVLPTPPDSGGQVKS